ncbi:unnamed protein product [Penicillium pancosmium]
MDSYRNDYFASHHPTSSAVDEMQPSTERVAKQRKQRKRSSAPEQSASQEGLEKKERRRRQLLLAQRAYRARNGAHIQALEKRVARLESALERTVQATISFTDTLVESQALASHQKIAYHLRDTVKTCLDMADDCLEDVADSNSPETSLIGHTSLDQEDSTREKPTLRQVCVRDEQEEWPFSERHAGLSVLSRNLFPPSALNGAKPDHSSYIPSFRLGGAGTHYPEVVTSNQMGSRSEQHDPSMIHDTLSAFSPEAQKDLDGQWFDLFDLVGFLRAQGTTLSMVPPVGDTTHRTVNAVDFTAVYSGGFGAI